MTVIEDLSTFCKCLMKMVDEDHLNSEEDQTMRLCMDIYNDLVEDNRRLMKDRT